MAKTLGKALGTDLNEVAALLRSKGRKGDTVLAHINPEEAALLKARGGAGTLNPETGLPEFWEWTSPSTWFGGGSDVQTYDDYPSQQQIDAGTALPTNTSSLPDYQYIYDEPYRNSPFDYYYQQPAPEAQVQQVGGFGTAAPFVGTARFDSDAAFGSAGVPVPTDTFAAGQIDQDIAGQQPDKNIIEKFEDTVRKYPSTTAAIANLAKFGLGGLATIPLQRQQQRAAQNTQAMADEISALGAPIRQQGQQMLSQAQAGQLTPEQQQRVQALRAQQNQALSRQGVTSGVAQQQAEANVQRLTQQFVANNINNALNMVNIGNRYAQSAITQGYNANQQANQSANLFYQNLFAMMGGYAPRLG